MGKLDKSLPQVATKLVKKFGRNATYQVLSSSGDQVYNEDTGLYETTTGYIDKPTIKISPPKSPTPDELVEGQVLPTDLMFMIDAQSIDFEPKANDRVVIKDKTFTVKSSRRIDSGELTALYKVVVTAWLPTA